MTTLLIGKGFRRFAFLVKDMSYNVDRKRHEGFCRALIKMEFPRRISFSTMVRSVWSFWMRSLKILYQKVECIICSDDGFVRW